MPHPAQPWLGRVSPQDRPLLGRGSQHQQKSKGVTAQALRLSRAMARLLARLISGTGSGHVRPAGVHRTHHSGLALQSMTVCGRWLQWTPLSSCVCAQRPVQAWRVQQCVAMAMPWRPKATKGRARTGTRVQRLVTAHSNVPRAKARVRNLPAGAFRNHSGLTAGVCARDTHTHTNTATYTGLDLGTACT